MLPKEKWARGLIISAYLIIGAVALYFFFTKALSIILPFIFAWLLAFALQNPLECLVSRLKLPRKLLSIILTLVVILFFGFIVILLANQLLFEVQRIFGMLSENSDAIISSATELLENIGEKFPFIYDHISEDFVIGTATEILKNAVGTLTTQIASILASVIKIFPDLGLFCIAFIIAAFYICADFKKVNAALMCVIPDSLTNKLSGTRRTIKGTGAKYLKAYSIIMLVTTAELFIGFIILRVEYALTLALIIAVIDILPVLGVGSVLLPWSVLNFALGNGRLGTGLLLLFLVITIVREVIEPKIVGECIGMHPLLTLIAMYIGYRLIGILGLIAFPPIVLLIKNFFMSFLENEAGNV